jgi:predicted transcriptional regulator
MVLSSTKPLRLGDLELGVLEYLWANGEASAKTVHAEMKDTRQNGLNTVQSTLDRLYKKGILDRTKVAHSFLYKCRYSRTEILTQKISDLAQELSKGETQALLAAFVEFTARLDDSRIAELEAMVAARRSTQGRKS